MSEITVERAELVLPLNALGKRPVRRARVRGGAASGAAGVREPALDVEELLRAAAGLADEIAGRPNRGEKALPREDLKRMAALGLLRAPLPAAHGGLGLGLTAEGHLPLLRLLATVGGADLVLGRLYEGHVNAVLLVANFGTEAQLARAAEDCRAGRWFGVWNTGPAEKLRLEPGPRNGHLRFRFRGGKTFASGAGFVTRPIVTAEREGGGWQMTLVRMDAPEVAGAVTIDRGSWQPLGMEASESFGVDFSGAVVEEDDLIGQPGDFYRDPLFYGGTIRYAAVQAGAMLRMHRMLAERMEAAGNADPYQLARMGEVAIGAQEAVLWIERAAAVASECFRVGASKLEIERMHETADMTRLAIERIANAMLPRIVAGVGARGLLQPSPFERMVRDLTMYLRQPTADYTLATVGRTSLRKAALRAQGAGSGFWTESGRDESLPAEYFERLYRRKGDPWEFETSGYEAEKYRQTLAVLPKKRYGTALEVGCSIGVLTAMLAGRVDALLGVDVSEKALETARRRTAKLKQVRLERMQIPRQEPEGMFELILISEVAYYWQREDLERAMAMVAAHQGPGGHLLLVHHTKPVPDYPLTGDQVHEAWLKRPEWRVLNQQRHEGYRLELLERCP